MQTLPIMDELEAALAGGTNARRIEMLTRITDLFVGGAARFTEAQTGVFDDIMVRLVSAIEAKARAKLAHRLAPIANAPLNTIHMLAFDDDIEVAATVLSQSERLDENALLANAGSKSQQHLFAIAQRKSLSEAVTDMLVERGDREVVHSMVKNSGARFSDAGFRMLVKRSAGDDDLAAVVGLRSDIPHPHFLLLQEKTSSAVRARLVAENPEAGAAIDGVVAEAVGGIRSEARKVSPDFATAQAEVERRNRIRRIGEAEIYQYACERKFEETAIALSLCAIRRSTSSSARSSIPAPRSCSSSPRSRACHQRRPRRSCCCAPPIAACRRRTSNTRFLASTGCSPTRPAACSASSAPASRSPHSRQCRRRSPSMASAALAGEWQAAAQ
mgnify:CR=1 FL=1